MEIDFFSAADATSHLFFAYLRSISPDLPRGMSGIATLPIALQNLVQATEYPPETPTLLQVTTTKVVMIVDTVSPTPFALLRRAKNFEYRDSDRHLQEFTGFEDPVLALTDECHRVLKCVASSDQTEISDEKTSNGRDESWSRFEDIGFGNSLEAKIEDSTAKNDHAGDLKTAPQSSGGDLGRPTTPSWADFMSFGFSSDESILRAPVAPLLLPPDKVLPPLSTGRGQSSQSHKRTLGSESDLERDELASIATLNLDDSFWWVWISSLAGEEPAARKAVFGRCALVETVIQGAKWLVLEEQVRGAAPEPDQGAYIVEKKRFFGLSSRMGKLSRRKSSARKVTPVEEPYQRIDNPAPQSKTSIGPDQHARVQAAAAALQKKNRGHTQESTNASKPDNSEAHSIKTNSILTLQPSILNEASQAMKWAKNYDKDAFRAAYLGDNHAGKGASTDKLKPQVDEKPSTPTSQAPSVVTTQTPVPEPKEGSLMPNDAPSSPAVAPASAKSEAVTTDRHIASRQGSTASTKLERPTSESRPKPSIDSTEDSGKKLKKKPGFKSMFGTKKKQDAEAKPPMKPTGAETSAVAAARAALESKAKASQEPATRPPNGQSVLKKKPVPTARSEPTTTTAAPTEPGKSATPAVVEITENDCDTFPKDTSVPENTVPENTVPEADSPETTSPEVHSPPTQNGHSPSGEYDDLSRVDTKEQAAADQEFSRFDQGPLVEQPAYVPESPVSPISDSIPEESPDSVEEEVTGKQTNGHETKPVSPESYNPSYDRWAQIRKNAAERAAQAEAGPRMSNEDEGDTSGEDCKSRITQQRYPS